MTPENINKQLKKLQATCEASGNHRKLNGVSMRPISLPTEYYRLQVRITAIVLACEHCGKLVYAEKMSSGTAGNNWSKAIPGTESPYRTCGILQQ